MPRIVVASGRAVRSAGTATLSIGTVTVTAPAVTADSLIFITRRTAGGTTGDLRLGAITSGVGFVINSSSALDSSTVNWVVI